MAPTENGTGTALPFHHAAVESRIPDPRGAIEERYARNALAFRIAVVGLVWLLLELLHLGGHTVDLAEVRDLGLADNLPPLRTLLLFQLVSILPYAFFRNSRVNISNWLWSTLLAMDVCIATAVIHYFGGVHNLLLVAFYLPIIFFAAGNGPERTVYGLTAICGLAFSALVLLETYSIVPPVSGHLLHGPSHELSIRVLCIFLLLFGLVLPAMEAIRHQRARASRQVARTHLAGLSHELRGPLNNIMLAIECSSTPLEPQHMRDVRTEFDRLESLIDAIVRFDRPVEIQGEVDLLSLVQGCVSAARRGNYVGEHPNRLRILQRIAQDSGPVLVHGDLLGLERVLDNLLSNACHVARTRVYVHVRTLGIVSVIVSVHDDGPGVPRELMERIFDPFFTTKTSGDGFGLGLANAKQIVEAHGGNISVRNSKGGGAVFSVRLPRTLDESRSINHSTGGWE